ncbi:MAG TPA: sugar phosphate isomerase/epimerase family protein [Acidimicrobiales bacterium]|jgi:sugar phosphate isomerase/epimerase|nr:sugar phosphate isomerase/epimerase family protein [Acidimicrobiales bacterium]
MAVGPSASFQGGREMSLPRLSIAAVTTYGAPVEVDIAACKAAGAPGIGIWEFKLPPSGRDDDVVAAVREAGLRATLCTGTVPSVYPDAYFTEPSEPAERVKAMCASIERLAAFDPVAVLCVTGDPRGRDVEEMRRVTVEGLRTVARFAASLGITIGLEPYRADAGSLVTTLPDTVRLIDDVGEPNVAVIADTWHFWDLPGIEADLARFADRLVGVQINDRRDPYLGWCDRRLPGDGKIDLRSIFGVLDAAGYDGWYDVEVFSDDGRFGSAVPDSVWALDPYEVCRRCVSSFERLWSERRRPA